VSKKIFVLEPYLELLGGSERMAYEVAKGLAVQGWEVHLLYKQNGVWLERYQKIGAKLHSMELPILALRRPLQALRQARKVAQLIGKEGGGVMFTSYSGHLTLAGFLECFFGIRTCFHLGLRGEVGSSRSGRWAIRRISAGITPSENTRESWLRVGWPEKTIRTVPNWIDWEDYWKLPTKEEARKILERDSGVKGLSHRGELKVVANVGRLVEEKGIEVLLKAWRMGLAEDPDALLIVAGQGKPEYEGKLKGMAAGNVRFLGQVEDPRMVYRASDVTVVPSLWEEPFGLVPLEAVACGSLPLVSDQGFLPEIVQKVNPELIHRAGRAEELSRQMVLWFSRETASVTSRLRNFGAEKFSAAKGVQAYQDILESFLAG
jgi:glycosyltransferase involved in cell wall biosynthesis